MAPANSRCGGRSSWPGDLQVAFAALRQRHLSARRPPRQGGIVGGLGGGSAMGSEDGERNGRTPGSGRDSCAARGTVAEDAPRLRHASACPSPAGRGWRRGAGRSAASSAEDGAARHAGAGTVVDQRDVRRVGGQRPSPARQRVAWRVVPPPGTGGSSSRPARRRRWGQASPHRRQALHPPLRPGASAGVAHAAGREGSELFGTEDRGEAACPRRRLTQAAARIAASRAGGSAGRRNPPAACRRARSLRQCRRRPGGRHLGCLHNRQPFPSLAADRLGDVTLAEPAIWPRCRRRAGFALPPAGGAWRRSAAPTGMVSEATALWRRWCGRTAPP